MDSIRYVWKDIPSLDQLIHLYQDATWNSYLREKDRVLAMFHHSLDLLSAWDDQLLVGFIRVVGDGISILYIQDLLVLQQYQSKKIGSTLLSLVLKKYDNVRQVVLLSDQNDKATSFYRKNGFITAQEHQAVSFIKIKS